MMHKRMRLFKIVPRILDLMVTLLLLSPTTSLCLTVHSPMLSPEKWRNRGIGFSTFSLLDELCNTSSSPSPTYPRYFTTDRDARNHRSSGGYLGLSAGSSQRDFAFAGFLCIPYNMHQSTHLRLLHP